MANALAVITGATAAGSVRGRAALSQIVSLESLVLAAFTSVRTW